MDENKILETVSDNLRILRLKKRITQEYLAEKINISTKYLNMIENRKANPTILVVIKLCMALNVELNEVWKETN
ncbi:MAG: helix-turn-helix transcriptional regulator [bacterium]|nr:helix-turn-helix transcriptional regulator [bacterium]